MTHASQPVEVLASDQLRSRALFALLELSKALSSRIDLDDLLRAIVENASSVVDADRTSIFIYDPAGNRLINRVAQGLEGGILEVPLGAGIAGDVGLTRKLENIADVYADSRFLPAFDQRTGYRTRSLLCAPVLDANDNLLGVIQSVNKTTADRFDSGDEALMLAIASHVAVAFERAHLTEVHLRNERMEEALKLASDIQMRMLPAGTATAASFEIRAHLEPAKEVGGDLYDFFWNDDHLYFCIGDVSGKGVGAALVMAVTKTLFRANAALQPDPSKVLAAMNSRLEDETDASMFVTAICGTLDLTTGLLRCSSAGHDRPLLLRDGKLVEVELHIGIPLGVFDPFVYRINEVQLLEGDTLFFFTDGVTEATSTDQKLFGAERLREALLSAATSAPDELVRVVVDRIGTFVNQGPQFDDLTAMAIRFRGTAGSGARQPDSDEAESRGKTGNQRMSARFGRQIDALTDVFSFVGDFFEAAAIDPTHRFAVDFALEELFTNFVKYNPSGLGDIELALARRGEELEISLTDFDTARFDIRTDAPEVDPDLPLEKRTPGGLGVHLVKKMMDRVEYQHRDSVGTITLYKSLSSPPGTTEH